MLMTTKNETKDEKLQIDDKLVDTSTPQQMPSICHLYGTLNYESSQRFTLATLSLLTMISVS